jgi:hypothetical protein
MLDDMTLIASAYALVSAQLGPVGRVPILFPDGHDKDTFLVKAMYASPVFLSDPEHGDGHEEVVSLGRWAVQVQTFQLTSTDGLTVPLVVFGSGPSRAEAELPVALPCSGTAEVFLLGVSVPTKRFQFAIHLEGEEAQPAQAPDDNIA